MVNATVNTVLGPVPAEELGVTATHEALLSVYPGAQYAFDVTINRAAIFTTLKTKLDAFRTAGGQTIVDNTGMFHGRDPHLLEALSQATGIHIIASTGMGPESQLGGYFLTPQTNPPTPWPAEKFAALFSTEITEGVVVPRVERRHGAGLITTAVSPGGATTTDESLLRGAARAAAATGTAMSFTAGADPIGELEIVLGEGINPSRVLVANLPDTRTAIRVGEAGAFVGVAGTHQTQLIRALLDADLLPRLLLSAGATGVAIAHDAPAATFADLLTAVIPALGLSEAERTTLLIDNPRTLLAGN